MDTAKCMNQFTLLTSQGTQGIVLPQLSADRQNSSGIITLLLPSQHSAAIFWGMYLASFTVPKTFYNYVAQFKDHICVA